MQVTFKPGVPATGTRGIFWLWDGSLSEGEVLVEEGRRVLVTYDLAAPHGPERIVMNADGGKIRGYAPLIGHERATHG